MQEIVSVWLESNDLIVGVVSILLNILVAILGIVPSAFITAGTVGVLGFKTGLVILIIGEAAGAVISFLLYRKGLRKLSAKIDNEKRQNKFIQRLKNTYGIEAFSIVVLLRLLPFVPSGLVTVTAAYSKMSFQNFLVASTLGKVPALVIEASAVAYVFEMEARWKWGILLIGICLAGALLWTKKKYN